MNLGVYIGLLAIASVISAILSLFAYQRRPAEGSLEMALLMLSNLVWCVTLIFEGALPSLESKLVWGAASYLGIQTTPVLLLLFSSRFTQKAGWITRKRIVLLFIVPVFTIIMAFTNPLHHLLWSRIYLSPVAGGIAGVYDRGPLFLVAFAYSYSLVLFSIFLIFRYIFQYLSLFSHQAKIFFLSCLAAFSVNILYLIDNRFIGGFDPTPIGFVISGMLLALATLRFRMLDIVPIAWKQVAMNLQDGLLVLDQQFRIVNWNPVLEKWMTPDKKLIGRDCKELLSPWPNLYEPTKELLEGRIEIDSFFSEKRTVEASITLLYDKNNLVIGRVLEFHDISRLKETQRQLTAAEKTAQMANQAKSQFLANMSHEIRTPMNAIIGLNELLAKTKLSPKQIDYVVKAGNAAKNLLGIINDILDISKIDAEKMVLEKTPFLLDSVLENLSDVVSRKASEKGIEFIVKKAPLTDTVAKTNVPFYLVGDPLRLGQALINLCSNAIKFTEKGEVVVSIETVKQTDRSVVLSFEVRDTGIGMTQEQIDRLFTAYAQADVSTTRKFGGTGLGLLITKKIVDLMDGHIQVTSEIGKGSVFSFTAIYGLEEGNYALPSNRSVDAKVDLDGIRGAKILLAEDDEINQQVAREMLENEGFWVDVASNGEIACQKALQNTYDLVLMDLQMPVLDGIAATKQIREAMYARYRGLNAEFSATVPATVPAEDASVSRYPEKVIEKKLPIIALTADVMAETREMVRQSGMNSYLTKPIDRTELFKTLKKWINPQQRAVFIPQVEQLSDTLPTNNDRLEEQEQRILRLCEVLPSINVKEGLERIAGNDLLYLDILNKFAVNHSDAPQKIRQAIDNHDIETANRILHTMKGVSGNIGAKKIKDLTEQLEGMVRAKEAIVQTSQFQEFQEELKKTLTQISQILPNLNQQNNSAATLSKEAFIEKLTRLQEAIGSYDTQASELLMQIRNPTLAIELQEEANRMQKSLSDYNFDQALEICSKMRDRVMQEH